MNRRFALPFWVALDLVDYAVGVARCWVVELIYGPEPPTLADEKREVNHERLRRAFPNIDIDGSIAIADEGQQMRGNPRPPQLRRSMKPRPDPRRRLIVP
jgi:hypothetical protein